MTQNEKYKEKSPSETIAIIETIFKNNSIETEETWIESGISNCYSVRVLIKGTNIGQNGKGTTKEYARASGYAELMERLQTGWLYPFEYDEKTLKEAGFYFSREEKFISIDQLSENRDTLVEKTLKEIQKADKIPPFMPVKIKEGLDVWLFDSPKKEEKELLCIPFEEIAGGKKQYLPLSLLKNYYFTNGSCAGNTKDEALVQGLSEICERFVMLKTIEDGLTLPQVPEEKLKETKDIYDIICEIRAKEEQELFIMDASLGLGLPVVASLLVNKKTGSYLVKFGSHPIFKIALERTLTEILQGRNINRQDGVLLNIELDDYAKSPANIFSFLKSAKGILPYSFFVEKPSYEYSAFEELEKPTNSEMLEQMKRNILKFAKEIYIRDCNYLGFPTYQILVPEISMAFNFGRERIKEVLMHEQVLKTLRSPYYASDKELRKAIEYLQYKVGYDIENEYNFLCKAPVFPSVCGMNINAYAMLIFFHYKLGETEKVLALINQGLYYNDDKGDLHVTVLHAVKQYMTGIKTKSEEDLKAVMNKFYKQEWVDWVFDTFADTRTVLKKVLPNISCFECDKCKLKDQCGHEKYAQVRVKEARNESAAREAL